MLIKLESRKYTHNQVRFLYWFSSRFSSSKTVLSPCLLSLFVSLFSELISFHFLSRNTNGKLTNQNQQQKSTLSTSWPWRFVWFFLYRLSKTEPKQIRYKLNSHTARWAHKENSYKRNCKRTESETITKKRKILECIVRLCKLAVRPQNALERNRNRTQVHRSKTKFSSL